MSEHLPPNFLKRIGVVFGLSVAFIVMASIFTPERSPAISPRSGGSITDVLPSVPTTLSEANARARERARVEGSAAALSADAHEGLRSLGVIESGRYLIAIFATDAGARYTIFDNESQQELGTLLTAQQVKQLLPDVDLTTADFSAPSDQQPLMLADPQD